MPKNVGLLAPVYSSLPGAEATIFSSFVSSSSTVKLNLKFSLPLPIQMYHSILWLFMICKQLLYHQATRRNHGEHSLRHRWHETLCLSINAFVTSNTFLKKPADTSFKHITALSLDEWWKERTGCRRKIKKIRDVQKADVLLGPPEEIYKAEVFCTRKMSLFNLARSPW